ncbi:MAG: diguanylate cyclase [Polyangiaceae bacterium]|nr:diguanylate cyclase [Polyangiaceae bacterium]
MCRDLRTQVPSISMSTPSSSATSKGRGKGPISTAAVQIAQAAVREGVTMNELSQLAQADPGFALRLLSVVNSAAFKRRTEVRDIPQAAMLLGVRGMRNIALSLAVTDLVPMGAASIPILTNCMRRAVSARLIAEEMGLKDLDSYFTLGLLLELGLLSRAHEDPGGTAAIARIPAHNRVVYERAAGLSPHPETGANVAAQYLLPPDLVAAIRHHHDPELPTDATRQVAWLAERASGLFECVDLLDSRAKLLVEAGKVGLTQPSVDRLLEEIPPGVAATASAFDRDLGPQLDLAQLRADVNLRLVEINLQYHEMVASLERLVAEKTELATQLNRANEALEQLVGTDALTGLPNRRLMDRALARDLAAAVRDASPLSIAMLDVDRFGNFNSTYGHPAGDEALRTVAKALTGCVRASDLAARYGGEEFLILLPRTDLDGAALVCERVRAALESRVVKLDGCTATLTASLGVATLKSGENAKGLIARADAALYEAKRGGRNRVHRAL